MTKNKLFAWAITLLCFSLTSCSDEKDGPSEKILVTNAGVTEANQTVKPGDIVHIYGDGFQEGDQVDFDFRWDLGEPLFPEGYLGPVSAEIVERHSNGMSIRMPYRKPESRVEIFLNRASERMSLGKVLLADGQTPKDFRLYGINETDKTIERAYAEETVTGKKTWDMSAHPDFRSVVNLQKTYGLCGLAKENGVQQPFFLDFCTGEWKALSFYDYNTLALVIGREMILRPFNREVKDIHYIMFPQVWNKVIMQLRRGVIFLCRNLNLNFRKDLLLNNSGIIRVCLCKVMRLFYCQQGKETGNGFPCCIIIEMAFMYLKGLKQMLLFRFISEWHFPIAVVLPYYTKRRSVT